MKIEVAVLISLISVCASIYFGLSDFRRNQKTDDCGHSASLIKHTELTTTVGSFNLNKKERDKWNS